LPHTSSARLAALTVAAVCSAASTVVLTSPAHADSVHIHDIRVVPWMSWMRTASAGASAGAEANADDGPTSSPAATAVTVTATDVRRARGDMVMASGAE
jgi:hypothetical protein